MSTSIRHAANSDSKAIESLYLSSFPDSENRVVADLALELILPEANSLSLVSVDTDVITGHIAFSPVLDTSTNNVIAHILAPLAVSPQYQSRGIGSLLVRQGLEQLESRGCELFFVYGDPAFYGKFGFDSNTASDFIPPYPLEHPHGWLAMRTSDIAPPSSGAHISCVKALQKPDLW